MGTLDYEALIEKRRENGDAIEQRKQANKLAEIARNLESLKDLADAEAKKRALDAEQGGPASEQTQK